MIKIAKVALCAALLLALCLPSVRAADTSARQRLRFDSGWRFLRGELPGSPSVSGIPITAWRWKADDARDADAAQIASTALDTSGLDWKDAAIGQDVFGGRQGFAWFRATLPRLKSVAGLHLHFEGVDDNATVYLDGQRVFHHEGWDEPFDVPLSANKPMTLAVLVQNTAGGGGISGPVSISAGEEAAPEAANPKLDDRAWRSVHLPHDFIVEGVFDPKADGSHGFLPTKVTGWYRKTFDLPRSDKGKSLWIDFDGVYRNSTAWLNGHRLGNHACGYTSFRYDITQAANYGGRNVLAVHVDPTHSEGWWYEGGGIYRHIWLNKAAPVHVAPWGVFANASLPEPGADGIASAATVTVKTAIVRPDTITIAGRLPQYQLVSRVLDPAGRAVGMASTPVAYLPGQTELAQQITVARPLLWSIETPRLYRLHTEIQESGRLVDAVDTPFGIRTLRYDANLGFFLNGKSVKIKGTCNHQDFAGVGVAVPDSLEYWRVKTLKAMGANAWRMSHNPPTPELLDACDKLGMLVMDENRHLGDTESGKAAPNTPATELSEVKSVVLRDRNHPSIIMWSLCNEEGIQGSPDGARIGSAMKKAVDALDGSRPVTAAMNGGHGQGLSTVLDLEGFNYSPGSYAGYHRDHPDHPLFGSETASAVTTRGIYSTDKFKRDGVQYWGEPEQGYVSAYDVNAPGWAQTSENAWRPIAESPYVAGGFVWTGFDYKGEPTPYGWPCINSHFGILDMCGFPKDNYYYYKAWWGDKPSVHILPHWNWPGKEGQAINVWVQGNSSRVELFLNGASLGAKDMPRNGHLEWSVPYAPGTLEARGYDGAGKLIATDKVETAGPPAALRLSTDRTVLSADGEDVTMIDVAVVDAQGRVVPTADNRVSFQLTGAGHIAGVGNGDPSDHDPDKAANRRAFNGLCLVVIQASEQPGDLRLMATAPGLKSAMLNLRSQTTPGL